MGMLVQVLKLVLLLSVPLVPLPLICTGRRNEHPRLPYLTDKPIPAPLPKTGGQSESCPDISPRFQRKVLGPMFNPHYMSVETPPLSYMSMNQPDQTIFRNDEPEFRKRNSDFKGQAPIQSDHFFRGKERIEEYPFYFREDMEIVLSEQPAKNVSSSADDLEPPDQGNSSAVDKRESLHTHRDKRHAFDPIINAISELGNVNFKWHCDAPTKWMFLGDDYVPKYLRSVDCNYSKCHGPRFRCNPLSFSIVVLRIRKGSCPPSFKVHGDQEQMPIDLRKYFVKETRPVHFCCVCSLHG